nr:CYP4AN-like protein [Diaphanosoma celebensis]
MLVTAAIVLATSLLLAAYWRWERSRFVSLIDRIPGPVKRPLVGNAHLVPTESDDILEWVQLDNYRKYGHIFRIWFGLTPFVDINRPAEMEVLLTSQKLIDKSDSYDFLAPWLGDGLLLASGDKWRRTRRLLTPAFHFQILDDFFHAFNRNADILCRSLSARVHGQVDVYPFVKKCTLDIICESAMGIQVNAQLGDSEYITAVKDISGLLLDRFMSLWRMAPDWLYYLSPRGRQFRRCLSLIHQFTVKVIRDRKVALEREQLQPDGDSTSMGQKKRRAFLDLLLLAARNGDGLSEDEIRNQVDTFMFEGHDTTASAITWFLYCMATHPDVQERVLEEMETCLGPVAGPLTAQDLGQLKYLDCCIKEALRLYPPVPNIKRFVSEDLPLGGYTVPAGASISLHIYALHRRPELFTDPLEYRPERFLVENLNGRNPFNYVPFSAGPRNCIGQRFALYEEKVVACCLLRKFRLGYDPARPPVPVAADLVLKPKGGMPLILTARSDQ